MTLMMMTFGIGGEGMEQSTVLRKAGTFQRKCRHNAYIVDDQMAEVECGLCGAKLNPIWVLTQLCNKQSRAAEEFKNFKELAEKAKQKNLCKCEKCGEFTRIQRR